jgi:putative addiction module component (TIGR02574 family)
LTAAPIAELHQLPKGECLALTMALRDSLGEEARNEVWPVNTLLAEELDRRWAAHLQDPPAAVPWDQVHGQMGLG